MRRFAAALHAEGFRRRLPASVHHVARCGRAPAHARAVDRARDGAGSYDRLVTLRAHDVEVVHSDRFLRHDDEFLP
jgi:hypothetical protein